MEQKDIKTQSEGALRKKKALILALGSAVLCIAYMTFLMTTSYFKIDSYTTNGIATIVFVILYFGFVIIVKKLNGQSKKINKTIVFNTALFIAPFILAIILYAVTKNIVLTLFIFMLCQIIYTIYYNNFVPVPGYKGAYKLYRAGNKEMAIERLQSILKNYPESFETLAFLGSIYIKDLEYHKAIECLEKAKELRNDDSMSYLNLSIAYTAIEEFDQAIECSKKVVELLPEKWNSYYSIALCNLLKEEYDQAALYFAKVLEFNIPQAQKFLVYYGRAKSLTSLGKEDDSNTEFNKSVKYADEKTISYWITILKETEDKPNKPSLFVKEAIDYAINNNNK